MRASFFPKSPWFSAPTVHSPSRALPPRSLASHGRRDPAMELPRRSARSSRGSVPVPCTRAELGVLCFPMAERPPPLLASSSTGLASSSPSSAVLQVSLSFPKLSPMAPDWISPWLAAPLFPSAFLPRPRVKLFCRCARPSPIAAAPWLLLPRHGRGAPPCLPRFCCELVPGAGFPPCIARLLPQARALPVVAPGSPLCRAPLHQLAPSLAKQVAAPSRVYPCVQPWVSLRSVPAPRPVSCSPDRVSRRRSAQFLFGYRFRLRPSPNYHG
jgi:hypothetical protein